MKSHLIFYAIWLLLLSGCVSFSKYNAAMLANAKQRAIVERLNKKIKLMENKTKELKDSLALYNAFVLPVKSPQTKTVSNFKKDAAVELSTDSFQNENEKRILYYMNYARVKPQEFLLKYVIPNLRDTTKYYERTLIETLRKMKPVAALKSNKKMFELATCHAKESGRTGYVGHGRQNGCSKGYNAECCAYGSANYSNDKALNYVLQLLVDEDVPSLGHREIILLNWLKTAGVSIQPHKTYGENVVIDFSTGN